MKSTDLDSLNKSFLNASAEEIVRYIVNRFGQKLTLASSLGVEDQVLTHMYATETDLVDIFVIDTGRLHQETYSVYEKTMVQYAFSYRLFFSRSSGYRING